MKNEKTARRLQKALSDSNMTARELAQKSGVLESSVSHYINGSHKPSNLNAGKMAEVLHVNPLWLMGFDVDGIDSKQESFGEIKDVYLSLARDMQENDIDPDDIRVMMETLKKYRKN